MHEDQRLGVARPLVEVMDAERAALEAQQVPQDVALFFALAKGKVDEGLLTALSQVADPASPFFAMLSSVARALNAAGTDTPLRAAMAEVGIDLAGAAPQRLTETLAGLAGLLVTMGCGDECPVVPGADRADWPLPDPRGRPLGEVRAIRDEIRARVVALLTERGWSKRP